MFNFLLLTLIFFCNILKTNETAKLNDHEPVHILAAVKFPIDQISPQDTFTQKTFQEIDSTFGAQGIGLDTYQIEHIKKTYLYLIFLTKLEKFKNNKSTTQTTTSFTPFLEKNLEALPLIPTAELLNSADWINLKIDAEDLVNSTMWQLFCKSMVSDINTYLILGLKLIHNCEKQEFNYIPHFETSYYNQDYVQIRNINAVVRIKIELEQEIQNRYLKICSDWKTFLDDKTKNIIKLETQIILFQKTDFYQKTHNMHNLMGTQNKFTANQKITHEDLLSASAIASPLKEYVFGYFLLYELYGQLTSFMDEKNLDQVLTICSNSNLTPNIFPYIQDDYVLISELLAGKSIIQGKQANSVHPKIQTFKPEDLRDVKDWINPTRRTTQEYIKEHTPEQKSIQSQSFLSFFSDVGHDLSSAWNDIKSGVEKAADAVKDFGESVGYGIAGFALNIVGDTSEGSSLMKESTEQFKKATHDLEASIDDFGSAIKDGIVAPAAELTGDIVGFITDDKKIGADIDTVITNCSDALVNIAEQALNTAAVGLIYVYTLPEQVVGALIDTMVAAVVSIWNQQAALNICHSILRSLVTTYMMVAQVVAEDFHVVMSSLGTFMNSITTLFNDLIREMTVIITTGGIGLITNLANAAGAQITTFDYANKAADTAYNTLNQHRAIINQVIGVAVMIGADVLTGGAATTADVAIDAELEASLTETSTEAESAIKTAQQEVKIAQKSYEDATSDIEKDAAKTKLKEAQKNFKKVKEENETILKHVKETRSQAQDAARDAKETREATTTTKQAVLKTKRFFREIGRAYKNLVGKSIDSVKSSLGRSWKFLKVPFNEERAAAYQKILAEPTQATLKGLDDAKDTASGLVARAKNIPNQLNSLLADENTAIYSSYDEMTKASIETFSSKLSDLENAQNEFDQALNDYKTSLKNPEEFPIQQKKLLNAVQKLRKTELSFESANKDLASNLQKITDEEVDFDKDPLKSLKENAEQDVKAAESNLESVEAIGNQEEITNAQAGLKAAQQRLKNIENAISKTEEPETVPTKTVSTSIKQQISEKYDSALEYVRSKARNLRDIFTKSNAKAAQDAQKVVDAQETELKNMNEALKQQQKDLENLQKETPPDQNAIQAKEKEIEDQKAEVKKQESKVERSKEYAKSTKAKAEETFKETAKRYASNAFSPIGAFMNIAFNFTSIIGGYNQDQKNLLQQKTQEEALRNSWRANTQNQLSTSLINLAFLDEFAEKQKASIGNQVLGLALSQNYSYVYTQQLIQSIQQSLAMLYTIQLYPNSATGLIPGNTGTLWGLLSNYLNIYPSEGFYTTTLGRADFPYAEEIAQAPQLLTQASKSKTKQWFNQRCTAVDLQHKNGILKQPSDPINVALNLKFLYTLDSEFYVGIYLGGSYHNYFAKTYLASLLGTTSDKLTEAYTKLSNMKNPQDYPFNLKEIDVNETYMAKMVVLYRKSAKDVLSLGVYEQNLTNKEWILEYSLPLNMQLNQDHVYQLDATLDQGSLKVNLTVDNNPQTTITKTVTVTPVPNQRMYGVIASSAAVEWNQTNPIPKKLIETNVRKTSSLTTEVNRNKENKLMLQQALNQTFGGKVLTLISKNRTRIFGQYIYASAQTDLKKIIPKSPVDLLIFATNTNGVITNLGKNPNSFKDSATNVLVSLITGHVFDSSWNCISTIADAWQTYSASDYAPFLKTLINNIEKQQRLAFSKLKYIHFAPFDLNAVSMQAIQTGIYLYTCNQTLTDASHEPFTDYVVLAPTITNNQIDITLGLAPTAPNAQTIVSLITGNVYEKNSTIVKNDPPTPITTISMIDISTYLKQNLPSYSSIIFAQTQNYAAQTQQKPEEVPSKNITQAVTTSSTAPNKNWFTPGQTFHFTFRYPPLNFANRQREAAATYPIQYNSAPKVS